MSSGTIIGRFGLKYDPAVPSYGKLASTRPSRICICMQAAGGAGTAATGGGAGAYATIMVNTDKTWIIRVGRAGARGYMYAASKASGTSYNSTGASALCISDYNSLTAAEKASTASYV